MRGRGLAERALEIAEEYERAGLTLTVRQLYYQLVARGEISNGDREYKRLVAATTDARMSGWFPPWLLEDRGRSVGETDAGVALLDVDDARDSLKEQILESARRHVYLSTWWAQGEIPWVWVEKDALSGVFEKPCKEWGVGLFACRGYPSVSSLWSWIKQVDGILDAHDEAIDYAGVLPGNVHIDDAINRVTILYFGDHDPDGLQIPITALEQVNRLIDAHGNELHAEIGRVEITVERIGLNLDQIRKYDPPPFPAKQSSARYDRYVEKTGLTDAWELDALEPRVLASLARTAIEATFDRVVFNDTRATLQAARRAFVSKVQETGWFKSVLDQIVE